MRRILIETVPKCDMRPPYSQQEAGGDWYINELDELVIRVIGDDLADPETFLIAFHELFEAILCWNEGVPQDAVDEFDKRIGPWKEDYPEPGDHPKAPYRTQHRRAMLIEHMAAYLMGISDYGKIE